MERRAGLVQRWKLVFGVVGAVVGKEKGVLEGVVGVVV